MKKSLFLSFLVLPCLSLFVWAQGDKPSAKNLYESYIPNRPAARPAGRPGSKVWVELQNGRKMVPVDTKFYSGESIRLHLQVNYEGYLTVLNQGTTGELQLIYPRTAEQARTPLAKTKDFVIPTKAGRWLTFDDKAGVERLTVIMSAEPIQEVLAAVAAAPAPTGTVSVQNTPPPTTSSSAEVASTTAQEQAVLDALNSKMLGGNMSKNFIETDEQESDTQATYIVTSAPSASLQKPVVFRLNLKHYRSR
jgi:Domain of unknown function (DUF4384)